MALPPVLATAPHEPPALDYAALRQAGLQRLERLGGQLWTDFNTHDPGLTILEQVCYALTDLAYRSGYDLKDLLASGASDPYRSLPSPAQVLPSQPVTLTDLRKLALDVEGVKNAWFEPLPSAGNRLFYDPAQDSLYLEATANPPPHRQPVAPRGLYRVLIEDEAGADQAALSAAVNARLQANRGLGEDFTPPFILESQKISIKAEIEISAVQDPEQLLAKIYHALAGFISPHIRFHSLQEMLAQGRSMDEILEGPRLVHGFIDEAELAQLERKPGLRASDLVREIMAVGAVLTVNNLSILGEAWYLKLNPDRTPVFDSENSTIRLMRGRLPVQVNSERVKELFAQLQQRSAPQPLPASQLDIRLPAVLDRQVGRYHSILHQFPANYGLGSLGLLDSASPLRKAQARQLKAYLLFFDQLLANYFAQLEHARDLFSFYTPEARTYFSQAIESAGLGLDKILPYLADGAPADCSYDPDATARKNRFLDHLLARFGEHFTDYSLLLYAQFKENELIADKSAFLREYHQIGAARGSGFDYTQPAWEGENISGLEQRLSLQLGLGGYAKYVQPGEEGGFHKRRLTELEADDRGGFHLLEHFLLRPNPADEAAVPPESAGSSLESTAFMARPIRSDPYSQQVSFIFPDWVKRLADPSFRQLLKKTLREETPAHLHIYLHWLAKDQLRDFESAYQVWLETTLTAQQWQLPAADLTDDTVHACYFRLRDARDRMIQILGLGTPYPLRDLKLVYQGMIAQKQSANIQITDAQMGIRYLLCNEDGNPYGNSFEVCPTAAATPENPVFLPTPPITRDTTFTVLAIHENPKGNLETYLNQKVEIKAGIDTTLQVVFNPSEGQVVRDHQITIHYGETVSITIFGTQEGISYKLIDGTGDISRILKGNQRELILDTTKTFSEDTQVNIRAYRTSSSSVFAFLDAILTINVRPDPAVQVNVETPIIVYDAATIITLVNPQASVTYHLYKRELSLAEYLTIREGSLVLGTDAGREIFVRPPEKVTRLDAPAGFTPVEEFRNINEKISANTGSLSEDTLFIIRATKTINREQLQLNQAVVVLVRPNPAGPVVAVQKTAVTRNTPGMVTVSNTQKGVSYQLRRDTDDQLVNHPGYHLTDRGIEKVRLEVDLIVGDQGQPVLLLPTDLITERTTFNILATKFLTGVTAQLDNKATIQVQA